MKHCTPGFSGLEITIKIQETANLFHSNLLNVSMCPTDVGTGGWAELSTGFFFGSEQPHLPSNNLYLL